VKKQFLVVIALVALAAAGAAYYYFSRPIVQHVAIEAVLPAETVSLIKICDLTQQIEELKSELLGQSLAKMDLPAILDLLEVSRVDRNNIMRFRDQVQATVSSTWFDILFGREIALALQPLALDLNNLKNFSKKQVLDALVIIGRPKQPARVLESLNRMFAKELKIQTQPYKQWEIKQFLLEDGQPVYFALTDELVIAGMSLNLLQRCLDQSLDPGSSLLQAKAFNTYCGDLFKPGQTDLILFGDFDYFISTAREVARAQVEKEPEMAVLEMQLAKMKGLTALAMASYDDGGPLLHNRLVFGIDRNGLSPTLERAFGVKPADNPTLKNTPSEVLMYSWQNNFDLSFYWQEFQKNPELTPENIEKIKQEFSQNTGLELDSFLAAFGNQLAFLINDINTNGMFPIPEVALQFEVKKPGMIDQVIQKLGGQMGMPMQQETHNGVDLTFVALPLGADLSPAYVCQHGFCTIAVNKRLLKSILDAPKNNSLGDQPDFQVVDQGLSGQNNQISFMNVTSMIAKSREVASWSLAWMAATQPDQGKKAQKVAELVLNPLLDGFSMVNSIGSRVYVKDDRLVNDIYTSVNRP